MRPTLHPRLVNGRFGDPGLFVEQLHRRGALLFDLGDLSPLPARDLPRVGPVFVSHHFSPRCGGEDAGGGGGGVHRGLAGTLTNRLG